MFRAVRLQTSQLRQPLQGRVDILFESTAVISPSNNRENTIQAAFGCAGGRTRWRGADAGSGGTAFTVHPYLVGLLARSRARGMEAHGQSDDKRETY